MTMFNIKATTMKRREAFVIDTLELENLCSQYITCDNPQAAQALDELAARHGITLDRAWMRKRIHTTGGVWLHRRLLRINS